MNPAEAIGITYFILLCLAGLSGLVMVVCVMAALVLHLVKWLKKSKGRKLEDWG